jgi:hypothetical protein
MPVNIVISDSASAIRIGATSVPLSMKNLLDSRIDGLIGSALFPADY